MKLPIYFFSILTILALFNCDLIKLTGSSIYNLKKTSVFMFDDSSKIDLSKDVAQILKISIKNDILTMIVGYSGGCKEHIFKLYSCKAIAKSKPPQVALLLSHNANGDLCEAYITQELKFDLTALRLHLNQYYNYSGVVILQIYPPGSSEPFEPKPFYKT